MARTLVRSVDTGILSSMSTELPGYPFGSVTPFVLTEQGQALIYVSDIAQHTKNMQADPKVSLTVLAPRGEGENSQAAGRVTLVGDARPAKEDEAPGFLARYLALFPEARAYAGSHGFAVYVIEPKRVRHIAGFGQIFWVEAEDWLLPTAEWSPTAQGILDHMNQDHLPALRHMAGDAGTQAESVALLSIDPEGFHLGVDGRVLYCRFPSPCMTTDEVRAAMVALARR